MRENLRYSAQRNCISVEKNAERQMTEKGIILGMCVGASSDHLCNKERGKTYHIIWM